MLAAMVEFQTEGFSTDAAYTMHWKLALWSFLLQYLYLGGHNQFHIYFFIMKPYPFKDQSAPNQIFSYWLS